MRELLNYLLSNIVNFENDLEINEDIREENGRKYITYFVNANPEDLKIIIGKSGRTIKSISNILKIKAIKDGVFVDVRVNKPEMPHSDQPEVL